MIGAVFAVACGAICGGVLLALREYVRIMDRVVAAEVRIAALETRSFETDSVTASLCCQVQDLENELAVVGAVVFSDDEELPAASRPN